MTSTEEAPPSASARRRPRDRKDQIATAASGLFADLGYERVRVEDIARAVGITGRAVYRHYASKYDLLARTIFDGLALLEAGIEDRDPGADPWTQLGDVYRAMARVALDRRGFCILVVRECRHLTPEDRAERDRMMERLVLRLRWLLQAARPDLDDADADLLVWYSVAVLASTSFHHTPIARARGEGLLEHMVNAVLTAPVQRRPGRQVSPALTPPRGFQRASRREALLHAAIDLFASEGFAAARMEDVGARVGITGPSVYQHFDSKGDILGAALRRGVESFQLALTRALAESASAEAALEQVLRSYVTFALKEPDLMVVFLDEAVHLPVAELSVLRQRQRSYAMEWVGLLREVRPELAETEAYFVTHAALQIANEMARSGRGRERDDIEQFLIELMSEVMSAA